MKKLPRRPKKIKINDAEYKIVSRSKEWGKEQYGKITYARKLIEIAEGQKAEEYLDTMIHEIMHGIIQEYEVDMDRRKEEKFVTQLSNYLTDVLKKNPKLVDWLGHQSQKE